MPNFNNRQEYSNPHEERKEKERKMNLFFNYYKTLVYQNYNGLLEISLKDGHTGLYPRENRVRNLNSWEKRNSLKKQGIIEGSEGHFINDSKKLDQLKELEVKGSINGNKGFQGKINCK